MAPDAGGPRLEPELALVSNRPFATDPSFSNEVEVDGAGDFVVVWNGLQPPCCYTYYVNPVGQFASVGDVRALPGD